MTQETKVDSQQCINYLESETSLVKLVTQLTKEISSRYSESHQYVDMVKLNNVLKGHISLIFQVKKEQIPDFKFKSEWHAVILTLSDLSTLIYNIVQAFNNDYGSKNKWEWS